jgi:hypothetical protein
MRLVTFGVLVGLLFGLWNMFQTWVDPLAEDTLLALLNFYGPMFAIWGFAGYRAARHHGRTWDGIVAAATLALVSFTVLSMMNLVRVNLFLDDIAGRLDWQNMMARFQTSGFDNLRAFVNYDYLSGAWFKVLVASVIGGMTGLVGGLVGRLRSRAA